MIYDYNERKDPALPTCFCAAWRQGCSRDCPYVKHIQAKKKASAVKKLERVTKLVAEVIAQAENPLELIEIYRRVYDKDTHMTIDDVKRAIISFANKGVPV